MTENASRFPLFVDLTGRRCVIVGGGAIAERRAAVLSRFGAAVTVIAPTWAGAGPGVDWQARPYAPGDLKGAFLAVAATGSRETNRQVGEEARAAGIFVSVADSPEESSFYFPALCVEQGLVAGVVSEARDHKKTAAAAQAIRRLLEGSM